MSECLEDWQKRDKESRAVTEILKGPEPKPDAPITASVAGVVGFFISMLTLALAGVPEKKASIIALITTATCAGAAYTYKWFTHRAWLKEYLRQMEIRAPRQQTETSIALRFNDAKSALEYSCKYMDTALVDGEFTPCIVVATSTSKESGTFAVIDVPTDAGIRRGIGAFSTNDAPPSVAGKLCAAMIGPVIEQTGAPSFLIFAELEPTWSDGAWKIKRRF
ncbi:hypothetical protein NJF44_01200 [Pseudomonas guariconensis]|uniref:hypothetical protein n=1 Tax=Pseudomonas TaxID=286 RepID=UPI0020980164|nr:MULTISPECIES: hypothetical protein [Pseudomonas]MCO7513740.1 hypothetical protein [Pseudomonas putida]MCO7603859.1 hypothetical protein [Pseudomonas guariconensis]